MIKKFRPFISAILLVVALSIGVFYLIKHHSLLTQLGHIPISTGLIVFALYVVMLGVLMFKFSATLKICRVKLQAKENAKLNAHTLLINFFIPGQGGPVYTGAYLLKRHNLKIKNYVVATIMYYVIYALISVCLLLGAVRPWWQTLLALLIMGGAGVYFAERYSKKAKIKKQSLDLGSLTIGNLVIATAVQAAIQIVIYAVELHSVNHSIHFSQVITYTGAANLALFASLTPGAIGIRESFLLFTRHLNHISSGNILVASVIDRSVYLAFLLVLILLSAGLHTYTRFKKKGSIISKTNDKIIPAISKIAI